MAGQRFFHNLPSGQGRLNRTPALIGPYLLLFQAHITDTDGGETLVLSDTDWECAAGPVTESVWLGGESFDAGIRPVFDKKVFYAEYRMGKLKEKIIPAILPQGRVIPKESFVNDKGNTVVDFGINFAGTYVFRGNFPDGTKARFYFSEELNLDKTAAQKDFWGPIYDEFTFSSSQTVYAPKFVYHGFRYIEVEGIDVSSRQFEGIRLHCANREISTFACDNEKLLAIHKLIKRSLEDNMQSVLTDCPHREKLGWTECYHLLFRAYAYHFDVRDYFKKLLSDIVDAQEENGSIPSIVPPFTKGIREHALKEGTDLTPNDPSWCGALIFAGREYYRFFQDRDFLESLYPAMQRYLTYLKGLSKEHLLFGESLNRDLGDWGAREPATVSFVVSCVYFRLHAVMEEIAEILGDHRQAESFRKEKEMICEAVNERYLHDDSYDNGTQSANAIALGYGLSNDPRILCTLVRLVEEADDRLTVGEVALKPLFDVLSENGYKEMAYRVFMNAYGGFADTKTTLPETWEGKFSQNHAMLGSGICFLFEHIAGIRVGEDGKVVMGETWLPQDVGWFRLTYRGNVVEEGRCSIKTV